MENSVICGLTTNPVNMRVWGVFGCKSKLLIIPYWKIQLFAPLTQTRWKQHSSFECDNTANVRPPKTSCPKQQNSFWRSYISGFAARFLPPQKFSQQKFFEADFSVAIFFAKISPAKIFFALTLTALGLFFHKSQCRAFSKNFFRFDFESNTPRDHFFVWWSWIFSFWILICWFWIYQTFLRQKF